MAETQPTGLTATIADFASAQRFEDIPATALEAVKMAVIDLVACMHAALEGEALSVMRQQLGTIGLRDEARLYLLNLRASASDAARANACAGAWLDFDDVALRGSHPSSILASVLLAEGDAIGASGQAVLTAYAVGFEVWARLIERETHPYIDRGWHGTTVIGPVAAAAALSNLHRLPPDQAACALGLAASAAGGLTVSFGTDARAYHVGLAAGEAVNAVRLAKAGITGSKMALEAPRGLLAALSPHGEVDLCSPITDLGSAWRLATDGINLKKYPMALSTHRALDGFAAIIAAHQPSAAEVAGIELFIGPEQAAHRAKLASGHTPPLARVEIGLAALLLDGEVRLDHLDPAFHTRTEVSTLAGKVTIRVDPAILPDSEPNLGYAGRVRVSLADGIVYESENAPVPRGNWRLQMSSEDLWKKFSVCTTTTLGEHKSQTLFDQLAKLERISSLHEINA